VESSKDTVAELSHRIQADIDHRGGTMPEMLSKKLTIQASEDNRR
jgi:hypothetical protein